VGHPLRPEVNNRKTGDESPVSRPIRHGQDGEDPTRTNKNAPDSLKTIKRQIKQEMISKKKIQSQTPGVRLRHDRTK